MHVSCTDTRTALLNCNYPVCCPIEMSSTLQMLGGFDAMNLRVCNDADHMLGALV